jgi:hypothetical protein
MFTKQELALLKLSVETLLMLENSYKWKNEEKIHNLNLLKIKIENKEI